jgi:hypothetical protein
MVKEHGLLNARRVQGQDRGRRSAEEKQTAAQVRLAGVLSPLPPSPQQTNPTECVGRHAAACKR